VFDIPDQYFEQGSDTCFYITYNKNCNFKDDFYMEFEIKYNEFVFRMDYLENAELIDERKSGDLVYQTLRINKFNDYYKKDTLFKFCGSALLTDQTQTVFDIINIKKEPFNNYYIDKGIINTEEICFQQVMRIVMNLETELYVNNYYDNVQITVIGESSGQYELNIINTYSRSVFYKKWQTSGKFEYFYQLNSLPSGVYLAVLETPSGFKIIKKFIVIN
jgi:hypothetical protein